MAPSESVTPLAASDAENPVSVCDVNTVPTTRSRKGKAVVICEDQLSMVDAMVPSEHTSYAQDPEDISEKPTEEKLGFAAYGEVAPGDAETTTADSDSVDGGEQQETSDPCCMCGPFSAPTSELIEVEEEVPLAVSLEPTLVEQTSSVLKEHIVSFYTMPSSMSLGMTKIKTLSCPQSLVSYLPASPFITKNKEIGVDIFAIKADMNDAEELQALPEYTTETQQFKRQNTLGRSMHHPVSINMF